MGRGKVGAWWSVQVPSVGWPTGRHSNPRQRVLWGWCGGMRCLGGGKLEQESGCGSPRVGLAPGRVGGAVWPSCPVQQDKWGKGRRARGWGLGLQRRDGAPEWGSSPPLTSWLVLGVDSGGAAPVALQPRNDCFCSILDHRSASIKCSEVSQGWCIQASGVSFSVTCNISPFRKPYT